MRNSEQFVLIDKSIKLLKRIKDLSLLLLQDKQSKEKDQ